MTHRAVVLHASIRRSASEVYAYVSNPRNLTAWASGLSRSTLHQEGDQWIAESPMGRVKIRFTPQNTLGVVDHDVITPDGKTTHNPLRVQPNGDGSDVLFTLHRMPTVSDADFQKDQDTIRHDLEKLKTILEMKH